MSPVERVPSSAQTPRTHEGGTRHRGNRSTDARGRSGRGTGRRRGRGARRRPARGTAGKPAGAAHPTSPKSHRLQGGGTHDDEDVCAWIDEVVPAIEGTPRADGRGGGGGGRGAVSGRRREARR